MNPFYIIVIFSIEDLSISRHNIRREEGKVLKNDLQKDKLIEKMFDAALKEKFSQLGRKYKWELVLKVWAEIARCQGSKPYFNKGGWKPEMTIMEALDCLDRYCDSIEAMIQEGMEKEKEKKEGNL